MAGSGRSAGRRESGQARLPGLAIAAIAAPAMTEAIMATAVFFTGRALTGRPRGLTAAGISRYPCSHVGSVTRL